MSKYKYPIHVCEWKLASTKICIYVFVHSQLVHAKTHLNTQITIDALATTDTMKMKANIETSIAANSGDFPSNSE